MMESELDNQEEFKRRQQVSLSDFQLSIVIYGAEVRVDAFVQHLRSSRQARVS